MKFTLKDYQEQAVDDVLFNLKRARDNFKNPDKREISCLLGFLKFSRARLRFARTSSTASAW